MSQGVKRAESMTRRLLQPSGRRLARLVVLALALASLVFLLQVTAHQHTNGQDEAACLLCQAAHVSVTPAVSAIQLSIPFIPVDHVVPASIGYTLESFFRHSDPRAPPTAIQL
jgi:hypothetical protein